MAIFDMIRQRFRAIGRSDDYAADSNTQASSDDTRTASLPRPPGPVRAISESIARGLRGDSGGQTPSWFDGPERRRLLVSETADWTGRTTSAQRNGGLPDPQSWTATISAPACWVRQTRRNRPPSGRRPRTQAAACSATIPARRHKAIAD